MAKCSECGEEDKGEWVNFGIGPYEFWGACGCDNDWAFVSTCCEAELIDKLGNKVEGPPPPEPEYIRDYLSQEEGGDQR